MVTTRTRISGDFCEPTCSWGGTATRTRMNGDFCEPCGPTTVCPPPVHCSSSWSFWPWHTRTVVVHPNPIGITPSTLRPASTAEKVAAAALFVGLIALIVLLPSCHTEKVCDILNNGERICRFERVCESFF